MKAILLSKFSEQLSVFSSIPLSIFNSPVSNEVLSGKSIKGHIFHDTKMTLATFWCHFKVKFGTQIVSKLLKSFSVRASVIYWETHSVLRCSKAIFNSTFSHEVHMGQINEMTAFHIVTYGHFFNISWLSWNSNIE